MPASTNRARTASLRHEREYQRAGCHIIVGMDEAGRGPLAGPVVAAAVALPLQRSDLRRVLRGARDSKLMSPVERQDLDSIIKHVALAWGICSASASEIDSRGIVPATQLAMERALDALLERGIHPDCLFLDYLLLPDHRDVPQVSLVDGDQRSLSIACASVLAKVWRDQDMQRLDARYPHYGFAQNKGYGTAAHIRALNEVGPCPAHRRCFAPVQAASCREGAPREARAGA